MDIGTLTGQVTLEDELSGQLDVLGTKVNQFADAFEEALGGVGVTLGIAGAAVVALGAAIAATTATIVELGEKGSTIEGVSNAFDTLAQKAGTTGDILRDSLSKGVQGTVDQFNLMKDTTKLLGSGMQLTADQATLMGQAARELGKATGTDASQGLEMMSSALTTGRTRQLQMQIGLIDVKAGEEEFAKSIGTTADQLNATGQLEGKRLAILEATQAYLDRVGASELSFGEKIQQSKVALEEWIDELSTSVAKSPEVNAAYDAISKAINEAFGGGQKTLMQWALDFFNTFADMAAKYAPPVIKALGDVWTNLKNLVTVAETFGQAGMALVPNWLKNLTTEATSANAVLKITKELIDPMGTTGMLLTTLSQPAWAPPALASDKPDTTTVFGDNEPDNSAFLKNQTDAIQKLANTLNGVDVAKKIGELNAAFNDITKSGQANAQTLTNVAEAADKLYKAGGTLPPMLMDVLVRFNGLLPLVKDGAESLNNLGERIYGVWIPTDAIMAEAVAGMKITALTAADMGTKVDDGFAKAAKAIKDYNQETVQAFNALTQSYVAFGAAVGGVFQTVTTLAAGMSKQITGAADDFHNAQTAFKDPLGSNTLAGVMDIASGITSIATAAIAAGKAIMSLWNDLFGAAGRDAVTTFAATFKGGFDQMHQQLDELGASGEALWVQLTQGTGRNNATQAAANIKLVTDALAALTAAQNTQVQGLAAQITALGGGIDPALDAYIQKLKTAGQLTDANAAALTALEGTGVPTFDQLDALAKKYNLTAAEMGPAFNAAKVNSDFQSVIDDLDEMTRGGINVQQAMFTAGKDGAEALTGLGTAIQGDIQDAINAGVAIPDNLKSAAEALANQGDLIDANGQKITDVSKLTFGESMQTSLDTLNDTLKLLIQTMTGSGPNSLTTALDTIGSKTVHPKIQPIYDDSGLPTGYQTSPTDTGSTSGAPAGGAVTVPIVIQAGTETLAKHVVTTFVQNGGLS